MCENVAKNAYKEEKCGQKMQKTVEILDKNAYKEGIMGQLRTLFGDKNAYMGKIMGQKVKKKVHKNVQKRIYGRNNWTEKCKKRSILELKTHI